MNEIMQSKKVLVSLLAIISYFIAMLLDANFPFLENIKYTNQLVAGVILGTSSIDGISKFLSSINMKKDENVHISISKHSVMTLFLGFAFLFSWFLSFYFEKNYESNVFFDSFLMQLLIIAGNLSLVEGLGKNISFIKDIEKNE